MKYIPYTLPFFDIFVRICLLMLTNCRSDQFLIGMDIEYRREVINRVFMKKIRKLDYSALRALPNLRVAEGANHMMTSNLNCHIIKYSPFLQEIEMYKASSS
jgi:hypothetical protein